MGKIILIFLCFFIIIFFLSNVNPMFMQIVFRAGKETMLCKHIKKFHLASSNFCSKNLKPFNYKNSSTKLWDCDIWVLVKRCHCLWLQLFSVNKIAGLPLVCLLRLFSTEWDFWFHLHEWLSTIGCSQMHNHIATIRQEEICQSTPSLLFLLYAWIPWQLSSR